MYLRAKNGISYLPQEASVFRKLTVEANIMAILETLPLSDQFLSVRRVMATISSSELAR